MTAFPNWELGELGREEVASTSKIESPNPVLVPGSESEVGRGISWLAQPQGYL